MRLSFAIFLFCSLAFHEAWSLEYTVNDCPSHVPRDGNVRVFGTNCYYFEMTSQHDFATAKQSCNYLGGFLATVDDSQTQQFMYKVIHSEYDSGFTVWIGLRNSGTSGDFVWDNGITANYFNWERNVQTAVLQDTGCAAMDTSNGGRWKLFPCHYEMFTDVILPFVCQIPITSECQVCGDVENDVACTQLEMTFARYVQCDAYFPFCMTDVTQTSGELRVFKRCANETTCNRLSWQSSTDDALCLDLGSPSRPSDDLDCHFCCHGNDCNRDIVPARDSLFDEGRRTTTPLPTTPLPTTPLPTTPLPTTPLPTTPLPTTTLPPTPPPTTAPTPSTTIRHNTHPSSQHTRHTTRQSTTPTTGTTATTPRQTTTKANVAPSECVVCGDLAGNIPCSDMDLVISNAQQCSDATPYCMNDIIQTSNPGQPSLSIYKRCVDEHTCRTQWYEGTSGNTVCTNFVPNQHADDLACHLCCHGDQCNLGNVPAQNTWYKP